MAGFDPALRVAMWDAWDHKCAWCGNPLDLEDLEVEHLIAGGLESDERSVELARHRLPENFDLDSTENLVPAHGRPCNRRKAMKPLPDSPVIAVLREDATKCAPQIDKAAEKYRKGTRLTKAVAVIEAAEPGEVTQQQHAQLVRAVAVVTAHLGLDPDVRVHSSVDPHDYVPPEVTEAGTIFGNERFRELLAEWAKYNDLDEVAADGFNAEGQELSGAGLRDVLRIGYVEDLDMFLARARFSVSYTHYDAEGCGGPADADVVLDLWVELDDSRTEVLEVSVDHFDTLPDLPGR